ncbi:MAG TPA: MBL fold metallo-hydrolase [Planctomycetota bacterium]|nr:MBL fold metallo-hydrolase [Planctomycetota bacterium]
MTPSLSNVPAFVAIALLAHERPASSPAPVPSALATERLADGVFAIRPTDEAFRTMRAWSNSGAVVLDDGVLVYDSQWSPSQNAALQTAVREATGKPIRWAVSSHYHRDHAGGGLAWPADVEKIAHTATRDRIAKWFAAVPEAVPKQIAQAERDAAAAKDPDARARAENMARSDREILAAVEAKRPAPIPTKTFDTQLVLGGGRAEIRFLGRGHTDGDAVLFLPKEKVVFLGDLFANRVFPGMGDARIAEWIETLGKIRELGATRYVPGHGPVGTADDFGRFVEYLRWLRATVAEHASTGKTLEETKAAVRLPPELASWALPERLDANVERAYAEAKSALSTK